MVVQLASKVTCDIYYTANVSDSSYSTEAIKDKIVSRKPFKNMTDWWRGALDLPELSVVTANKYKNN